MVDVAEVGIASESVGALGRLTLAAQPTIHAHDTSAKAIRTFLITSPC
jgi:hypothetical protein